MQVISTATDMVNLALARIGYPLRIADLFDGSKAAKKALDIYGQTRDALLREGNWGFAERIVAGTLSGSAAPAPWSVEYVYPGDCLQLRNLFNATYLANINDPLPVLWTIGNNATPARVIWCNLASATLVYTGQVVNPTTWSVDFIDALAASLGRRLAPVLANLDTLKAGIEDEKAATSTAMMDILG